MLSFLCESNNSSMYVISIEVLAANLRSHPDIVGLRPSGLNCALPVVSLYADDTSVIASSPAAIHVSSMCTGCSRVVLARGSTSTSARAFGLALGGSVACPPRSISFVLQQN